ncbi:MAG: hypothetical protein Q7T86_18255 [Hyphomicrobiaceae bacterium]|nr:hypothetical protein [Hyphomicrobiaceae bacterium]
MIVTTPEPAAQALLQAQARLASEMPIAPTGQQQSTPATVPVPAAASSTTPVVVTADPLAVLLQSGGADIADTPLTADLARRYAESGTLTQRTATDLALPKDLQMPNSLSASDAKLLNGLSQAYRQPATATPVPQPVNVQRELVNAQLPNAPATAGNTPAVIIIDGRQLPLNGTQTALVRSAIASGNAPDAKLLSSLLQPPAVLDADPVPLQQPASALRELAAAAIAQPSNAGRSQSNSQLPDAPRDQANLALATAARNLPEADLPAATRDSASLTLPAAPRQQAVAAQPGVRIAAPELPGIPVAANGVILVDGRTIALNPAQVALVRANLDAALRRTGGIGGSDGEDSTITAAITADDKVREVGKVQSVETSLRPNIEGRERHASPAQGEGPNIHEGLGNDEKVEAVRAVRHEQPAPYEPQVIVPRPQDHAVITPGPDRVILAGPAPETGPQSAITGIAIALAPGITRDDVTAELHQDGYRLTFAGSDDSLLLHASAGLSAQLMFADGTSMRLQLTHD